MNWEEWTVKPKGVDIDEDGFYICIECQEILKPRRKWDWECSKCSNRWARLNRKQTKVSYWGVENEDP